MRANRSSLLLALLAVALPGAALPAAQITIVNVNAPGVGFNDPTPAAPVGGNPGTTVGQQRLIAFQRAAEIWASSLDSAVEVRIQASFVPLACTASAATLGSAGAIQVFRDFPGAAFENTWYHVALANKLAFTDLAPGDPNSSADDLRARFNSEIGKVGCLTGTSWYYGLDNGHTASQINLVTVLLHEFAHGLGFSSFANVSTGAYLVGFGDVYSKFYFDDTAGKFRDQMTDAERQASAVNPRAVVWNGPSVTFAAPAVLTPGTPLLHVNAPAPADYQVGAASFGPAIGSPGITGDVALATDASNPTGPSSTDACTVIDAAAGVAGKIALVDRGACGFAVKVKNAQDAGAIAVIVADNVAGGPPAGLGGADPSIVIPSVRVTLADGNALRAALAQGAVNVTLGLDLAVMAGADRDGQVLLYTPNPVQPGSSVSHWDTSTSPNQLMEPAINADLPHSVDLPQDLTRPLLRDVGWYPDGDLDGVADDAGDQCLGSDLRATVIVGGEDTGVSNTLFTNGCTIADLLGRCDATGNRGATLSCSAHLTKTLSDQGFLPVVKIGAVQRAAARNP
ncbi:protease-associated PA domain protein [Anaeromyxobacter sp. K]|uniref:PA domain-containing protein n=1 Tax=Anaeromyxobacter sp. (strain K) TaxID=447217 RepID=UPI00015F9EB8|nr:PA domain-containing protein [Anaeromyxobacter sp. K]ACG74521.1 protease-associated PA domain protein [Anaeromyxobacter sp. K]